MVKPYAKAYRIGPKQNVFMEKSGLRVERDSPESALVQWRVKSKKDDGSGIIAYGSLSRRELVILRDALDDLISELRDEFGTKVDPDAAPY